MANIPEVYLLQATKKNLELAKSFQIDMGVHFFDHNMYDVKDALTAILALCDMEDMKQMPQVKGYIQRVTDLLNDVRSYYSSSHFNINHVMINVINILKKNYKAKLRLGEHLAPIKASIHGNQSHLEQVLLYLLIEAVESSSGELGVSIQMTQKERDAIITVKLEAFEFSSVVLKEITDFHKPEAFKMQMGTENQGTEITIRLPLSFDVPERQTKDKGKAKKEEGMKGEGRLTVKLNRPDRAFVHGAQERT